MRHGQGTRDNADVHDALAIIKKYNADQEIAEAPYSIGQRVGDTVKGVVPGGMGRMAKGRKESGKMANDVNKQWQSHLGKQGHKNQNTATVQDLSDFIEQLAPGTDASAFYQKAGIAATDPASVIPKDSQEKIILALAQSMNAGGGGTATTPATTTTTALGGAAQTGVDFVKRAGGKKAPAIDKDGDGIDDVSGTNIEPQVDTNKDGKDDATGEPITDPTTTTTPAGAETPGAPGAPGAEGEPGVDGAPGAEEPADPADPNTNKVLSQDPPEVQGPKGLAWKKDTAGQWKKSVHPFTSATPELAVELDKILSSGTKPDVKQAEIIDFISNLKNAQRTQLRKYIRSNMISRANKVGHS